MLDDDEVRELSLAMSTLGTVEADVVEDLLLEFVSRMSASGALMGNFDATERLLQQYLPPERVTGIMDEIRGPAGRNMWEKLSNVQEEVLANYLKNEYPQTIAVVLSKLKPEHAARVLAILPEDMALDVVRRMLRMEAVQKEVIERVEQTLRIEFMSNLSQTRRRDAHEVMAEIFNNFDRQTETRFITSLEEDNRESAERIKALMFTFDDLIKLDSASAQTLMRNVDKDKLGVALKGANEEVRNFFFSNMSTRAAKMLQRRHGGDGPGAAARRRRGAGAARQSRQGPRRQGRDHADQEPRRRRTGVLMAAPAKFLFDTDFSAPEKRANGRRAAAEIAQKVAAAEARAYRDGYDAAQREAKVEADRRMAMALEEIKISDAGHRRRASPASKRGWRPRRSRSRSRSPASCAARWSPPSRSARSPISSPIALPIWSRRRISWCASTSSLRARARADREARQAERLRGPAGDPRRARDRHRRLPHRMGRWRRRAGPRGDRQPRSTNLSGAIWRPGIRIRIRPPRRPREFKS